MPCKVADTGRGAQRQWLFIRSRWWSVRVPFCDAIVRDGVVISIMVFFGADVPTDAGVGVIIVGINGVDGCGGACIG